VSSVVDKLAVNRRLFARTSVFHCQYNSTNALYSSSSTCCISLKERKAKSGNIPRNNVLPDMGSTNNKMELKFCTNNPFFFRSVRNIFGVGGG